ncbi:L-gulonolactone oxidase 5 [Pseudolycoriella hygida]|uniref:L-gulonolactone oxidase 5 n=1 Tax=Pseudolycoriella hygida TaxID=35572 RepID=A0A9Q0NBQ8_9DIPT|nr:L-gulonolactone oxidase 5 [Pseudolycoriella hygida]
MKAFSFLFYTLLLIALVHSADPPKEYSSYRRIPLCSPSSYFQYPKSEGDVVKIVRDAIRTGTTVKAFGVRHSQTDIICTEGIPVDNQGLQFFKMNADGVTATFGAGVNLRACTEFLRKNGRALKTTPAYGNITLGGAIGTGAHGSTIKHHASISEQVVGVRIVDGMGNLRDITNREDLNALKLHLGLLGIVVKVTLTTVPLYKTRAYNYAVPDDMLTNGVGINWAKTTDQIAFYWFPAFKEVIVANWTIVDVKTPGNAWTNDHVPPIYENFALIASVAKETAFTLTSSTCALLNSLGYTLLHTIEYLLEMTLLVQVPDFVPIYTSDGYLLQMPAVGYYDLMFAPICFDRPQGLLGAACAWNHGPNNITILDNEFALDLADLPDFITDIKDIISKTPTAFPLQGILMRFSDKSDIYMSTAYGRQTVCFEFYLWNRNDPYNQPSGSLAGYQTILQLLTHKYKARSHWGKSGLVYHNSKSIDLKLDPVARQKFVAAMNKFDPNEVFINNFGRRLKGTGTKVDTDPLVVRCALLDNCFCTKNSDCGEGQTCTTLPGYKYFVCKTRNEVPMVFNKGLLPTPLNILNFLAYNVPTLISALGGRCTLGAIISTLGSAGNILQTFLQGVGGVLGNIFSNLG